jgi:hypothetical protein
MKSLAIRYRLGGLSYTLIGSSYFASWGQEYPYLFNKINSYFKKPLRSGFTTDIDNNGKTAHDRLRRLHQVHTGLSYPDTIFAYFSVNDMMYMNKSILTDKLDLTVNKVRQAHNSMLACCFSKTFNYFVDEATTTGTIASVTDTSNAWAAKCGFASKALMSLTTQNASVTFTSTGITNINYMVADGINAHLGTFDIYVDNVLVKSINTDRQHLYFPNSNNPSVPTIGDAIITPNSLILQLSNVVHTIKIVKTDASYPVYLDYHSEIDTSIENGAKGVYSFTIPKIRTDKPLGAGPLLPAGDYNPGSQAINAAMVEVYDFWNKTLGAPVAIADGFNGFDPINMMNNYEYTHFINAGSTFIVKRMMESVINTFDGKLIML